MRLISNTGDALPGERLDRASRGLPAAPARYTQVRRQGEARRGALGRERGRRGDGEHLRPLLTQGAGTEGR